MFGAELFDGLRRTVSKLASELRELQARLDDLCEQRRQLDAAPLPRSDVIAGVDEWIDAEAAAYAPHVRGMLSHFFGRARAPERVPAHGWPPPVLGATSHGFQRDRIIPPAAFWCFRETIREAIHREIAALDFSEAGPPLAEREAQRQALDKQITDLEQRIERLRKHAAEAGLNI